jgi:hypothetical protein
MKRYAIVRNARSHSEAEAYLPGNYRVIHETTNEALNAAEGYTGLNLGGRVRPVFVIEGEDSSGWTLDSYVIPRYASGLIACEEIDLSHPIMKQVPA